MDDIDMWWEYEVTGETIGTHYPPYCWKTDTRRESEENIHRVIGDLRRGQGTSFVEGSVKVRRRLVIANAWQEF